MANFGETLRNCRSAAGISLDKVSKDLHIKREHLQALEDAQWNNLPDPAFVKGFIRNYAIYLGEDPDYLLALYRREFDPAKFPKEEFNFKTEHFPITPTKVITFMFGFLILIFISYLFYQYTSFLKSPKLVVGSPDNDQTTSVPVALVSGQAEKGATVAINGEFASTDEEGNFSYQYHLKDGRNVIEIIASKKYSPKNKITRIVRLEK